MTLKPNTFYLLTYLTSQKYHSNSSYSYTEHHDFITLHQKINGKSKLLIDDKFIDFDNYFGTFTFEGKTYTIIGAKEI